MAAPLLRDEDALVEDTINYLKTVYPRIANAYPGGYFRDLIRETIRLAFRHNMTDVEHIRLFTALRWEISAGWFHEPSVAEVLQRPDLTPKDRFAILTTTDYAQAWENARSINSPSDWQELAEESETT